MPNADLPSFDTLRRMAKENPEALEALRRRLSDAVIRDADPRHQRRLRGLQFQIDMERRRAPNPLASCLRITQMMQASLVDLQSALAGEYSPRAAPAATVLPLAQPLARRGAAD